MRPRASEPSSLPPSSSAAPSSPGPKKPATGAVLAPPTRNSCSVGRAPTAGWCARSDGGCCACRVERELGSPLASGCKAGREGGQAGPSSGSRAGPSRWPCPPGSGSGAGVGGGFSFPPPRQEVIRRHRAAEPLRRNLPVGERLRVELAHPRAVRLVRARPLLRPGRLAAVVRDHHTWGWVSGLTLGARACGEGRGGVSSRGDERPAPAHRV